MRSRTGGLNKYYNYSSLQTIYNNKIIKFSFIWSHWFDIRHQIWDGGDVLCLRRLWRSLVGSEHAQQIVLDLVLQVQDIDTDKPLARTDTCTYWLAAPAMVFPIRHRRKPTRFETVNTRPITTNTIHFNLNVNRAVKNRQTWTWLDFTEMNLKAFPYPDHREGYQATPEYLDLSPRELVGLRRCGLEHPDGVSLVIDIVPPA